MTPQTRAGRDPQSTAPTTNPFLFIYRRHAVRTYEQKPVGDRTIQRLLDAAVHPPTSFHEEPWRFVVVQDRALLDEISACAKRSAVDEAAEQGAPLKPPGVPGDGTRSMMADPAFNIFYDAGTLVVICADVTPRFAVADCWLAAENLMFAAAGLGLGSCVIGCAAQALNRPEMKARLGIPSDVTAVAPIILGIPRDDPLPSPRRPPVVLRWLRANESS